MSVPLTLLETAELLGHYRHAELTGYAVLGSRALAASEPRVRHYLLRASSSHGYRARALEELLPVSATLPDAAALTVAIDGRIDETFAVLVAAGDGELVSGLADVLYPVLLASYGAHLERCSAYADPPLAVVLRRCYVELETVQAEGHAISAPIGAEALAHLEHLLSGGIRLGEVRT